MYTNIKATKIFIIIFLLLFILTYSPGFHSSDYVYRLHYGMLIISNIFFMFSGIKRHGLQTSIVIPVFLFCCIVMISSICGFQEQWLGFFYLFWHFSVYIFWDYTLKSLNKVFNPNRVIIFPWFSFSVFSAICSLVGIYLLFMGPINLVVLDFTQPIMWYGQYERLISWSSSPNIVAPIFSMAIIISLTLHNILKSKYLKAFNIGLIVFNVCGLILSGSRTPAISLILVLLIYLLLYGKIFSFVYKISIAAFILILLSNIFPSDLINIDYLTRKVFRIDTNIETEIITGRMWLWDIILYELDLNSLKQFMIGLGPRGTLYLTGQSTHSGWLSMFMNYGLFGTLSLIFILLTLSQKYFKLSLHHYYNKYGVLFLLLLINNVFNNIATESWMQVRIENVVLLLAVAQYKYLMLWAAYDSKIEAINKIERKDLCELRA